ncbi:hypothetical protein OROMI_032198 [Orobanche minor]
MSQGRGVPESMDTFGVVLPKSSQRKLWDMHARKRMFSTRWADEEVMNEMGITDDVGRLLERVQLKWLLEKKWPTYRCLTLEFLSTFKLVRDTHNQWPEAIKFRLVNRRRRLDMSTLLRIFEIPSRGTKSLERQALEVSWRALVERPGSGRRNFEARKAKSSMIRNPVMRYVHRIIASSIFARAETGTVTINELFFLYNMLVDEKPDIAYFLSETFEHLAATDKGEIWIGGLITPIALHFDIDVSLRAPLGGNMLLNFSVLHQMHFLNREIGVLKFQQNDKDHFPLPNPNLTMVSAIHDLANLQMASPTHQALCDRNVRRRLEPAREEEERMEEEEEIERETVPSLRTSPPRERPKSSRQGYGSIC